MIVSAQEHCESLDSQELLNIMIDHHIYRIYLSFKFQGKIFCGKQYPIIKKRIRLKIIYF
ncbi:unnamed protein product [Paramecium sonneborni]|uniref:Uncharacterized protein n=1 Tax=Paramecium sonneborni TaxID=65129 RepID=A0A8S1R4Y9_9CILI|nr:unnamed protein product [Paramecium sonneborni]